MELNNYLEKFNTPKKSRTPDQSIADEIYEGFYRAIKYGMIMKMIKEKGSRAVYMNYQEVIKSDIQKKAGAFINKCKEEKIIKR